MSDDPFKTAAWRAYAKRAEEELVPMLRDSVVSLSIVPSGETDIKYALELGMSIMLDKPIIALIAPGAEIPGKLRLVADHVIEVDLTDESSRNRLSIALGKIIDDITSEETAT
jgi:hypothetical protein